MLLEKFGGKEGLCTSLENQIILINLRQGEVKDSAESDNTFLRNLNENGVSLDKERIQPLLKN
jgi:hypothetical protein